MIEISPNDNWNIRPKIVMKYWLSSRVHSALIVQTLFPIVFPGNFNEWRLPASAQSKPIECLQVKPHFTLHWRHNEPDGVSNLQPRECLLNYYSGADQRKHQSPASLAFVRRIHRGPVNSPHKKPVTRKIFPFDDVIITGQWINLMCQMNWRNLDSFKSLLVQP